MFGFETILIKTLKSQYKNERSFDDYFLYFVFFFSENQHEFRNYLKKKRNVQMLHGLCSIFFYVVRICDDEDSF